MPSFYGEMSMSTWMDRQVFSLQRTSGFHKSGVNVNTETREARTILLFLSSVSRAAI